MKFAPMTDYTLDNPPPPELARSLDYVVVVVDDFGYAVIELRCGVEVYFLRYPIHKISYLHPDNYQNNEKIRWLGDLVRQNNPVEISGDCLKPSYMAAAIINRPQWSWIGDSFAD